MKKKNPLTDNGEKYSIVLGGLNVTAFLTCIMHLVNLMLPA